MIKISSIQKYSANEVINVGTAPPLLGHLPFANKVFKPSKIHPKSNFKGAGLYAVFFDNQLIYVGKFLGTKRNWDAGNVIASRWVKHIGTFSMLDRKLSFSKRALEAILDQEKSCNSSTSTTKEL